MAGKVTIYDTTSGATLVLLLNDQAIAAVEGQRLLNLTFNQATGSQVPLYPNWLEYLTANSVRSVIVPAAQAAATALLNDAVPKSISITLPTFTGVAHTVALTPQTITVSGGIGSGYVFTATGLPPGVSVDSSTGVISGTPAAAGTFAYVVTVTDPVGNAMAASGSITAS